MDTHSNNAKTVKRNARDISRIIEEGAAVAVTLVDDERVKPEYRGITIHGFWLGIVPNPKVGDVVRSVWEGSHWLAQIVDARSEQLLWEPNLESIEAIDIAPGKVQKVRES